MLKEARAKAERKYDIAEQLPDCISPLITFSQNHVNVKYTGIVDILSTLDLFDPSPTTTLLKHKTINYAHSTFNMHLNDPEWVPIYTGYVALTSEGGYRWGNHFKLSFNHVLKDGTLVEVSFTFSGAYYDNSPSKFHTMFGHVTMDDPYRPISSTYTVSPAKIINKCDYQTKIYKSSPSSYHKIGIVDSRANLERILSK